MAWRRYYAQQSQQTFVGTEDVFKQDMSLRRLQHVFSVTIFRLPRRLEDILGDILKTSWETKNCYAEFVFKTSWRHVFKTSWRRYRDNRNAYWAYLYLTNLTNLRWIQNALIRTQSFQYSSYFKTQAASLF